MVFFNYDSRLTHKEGFKDTVLRDWFGSRTLEGPDIPLAQKLTQCRRVISKWKREHRMNAEERINLIRHKLDKAIATGNSTVNERNILRRDLNQAYLDEEIYWKTKSRNRWLNTGDRNIRYFHSSAKARRVRNRILSIQDETGEINRGDKNIARIATNYFEDLFTSIPVAENAYEEVFQGFQPTITAAINSDLTRPISEKEIEESVFAVAPSKAPGPDGFTGEFYQQFWPEIKGTIIKEVTRFFEENDLDARHNHTNLCLIPEVEAPSTMAEFRPIALCNVSYKIISKILVNRLKQHLGGVITDNQAAFVPGRMITDNIIIAHEVYYALKARKRQANSYMALKTDITKAYDRLEWRFLEETMKRMGFDHKWISWIMTCVTSVSFSVLINGAPHGHFTPGRGIRQGDPLSPYLFILCAEVLSHMMKKAESSKQIQGIKLSTKGPSISHLLFADDSLFFTLANHRSCKAIKQILSTYEAVSGQAVNLRKSAITFGRHVKPDTKRRMRHLLGIHNEGGGGKYLGLPEQFDKKKSELFHYIVEKVREKTQGWSKKFLSQGGKDVLLKAVALVMPVYSMNLFKLTKEICEEINGILARFWWSKGNEEKGMHWFAWKRLSLPKREGGLGFKDLENFNLALLGKQTRRILQHPKCLMARMLKERYFPETNILNANQGKKASFIWKSILQGRDLLKKGLRFCIGDGSLISAWLDPWLPLHNPRPPHKTVDAPPQLLVKDLLNSTQTDWDLLKVTTWIAPEDVDTVLSIKLSSSAKEDFLGWHYTKDGMYTVKSAYWLSTHLPEEDQPQAPPGDLQVTTQTNALESQDSPKN